MENKKDLKFVKLSPVIIENIENLCKEYDGKRNSMIKTPPYPYYRSKPNRLNFNKSKMSSLLPDALLK